MNIGTIDGSSDCGECGTCGCSPCADGKFWSKKKWTVSGIVAQGATIFTSPTPPAVFTTTIDLSSLNGEWEMDAIARVESGVVSYKSGYDTGAMGEVLTAGLTPGFDLNCGTVYEITIEGVAADIYQGTTSYSRWSSANWHLTDCDMRVRLYEFKKTATTVNYAVMCVAPDKDGVMVEHVAAIYEDVEVSDSSACDATVLDVSTLPEYDQEVCQFIVGRFYSLTDTWNDGFDTFTDASFGLIDPGPLSGTANWTFEGAGTRIATL